MDTLIVRPPLDLRTRTWIAGQLLDGADAARLEERLVVLGVARETAAREIAALLGSDYLRAATVHMRRARKTEQLLELYAAQWRRSKDALGVAEVTALDAAEFAEKYYARNRPVIVRGGAAHWPAVGTWTPRWFAERFPDAEVEYMAGADRYAAESARSRTTMRAFADRVESTRAANDFYIVATNRSFRNGALAPLAADLRPIPFAPQIDFDDPRVARLWFGPRGTITSLHHDVMNVLFAQVYGVKEFILAPSFCWPMAYNDAGLHSELDPVVLDTKRFPRAAAIPWLRATVRPGDLLFIPLGWWHWVYAAATSISIGLGDFAVGGAYDEWKDADVAPAGGPFPQSGKADER